MKELIHGCVLAFQFLTRIPIPFNSEVNEKTLKWALRCFGLVGLVIGACISGVYAIFADLLPGYLLSLLLFSIWVFLTGGLHIDGWMDVADAAGSNRSVERKQEILKDSHIGSFAVIACIFLFLWKLAFLYQFTQVNSSVNHYLIITSLIAIPILARLQALWLLYNFKPFNQSGLAYEWRKNLGKMDIVISLIPLLPFMLLVKELFVLFILQAVFTFFYGKWAVRSFNGVNGDLTGASIEGAELWNLAIVSIFLLFVTG